jgi:hypothetical protein
MFARISASRTPDQAITAFASGASAHTMLSPPAVQHSLLSLLSTRQVLPLRLLCKDARRAVADFPWHDRRVVVRGSLAAWRACFPCARCANLKSITYDYRGRRQALVDADFELLQGLEELNMAGQCSEGLTDAAFAFLRGIHTLNMNFCSQDTVTDGAFAHLSGVQRLSMWACSQHTITGAALAHLRGVQVLNATGCEQLSAADFAPLQGSLLCVKMHDAQGGRALGLPAVKEGQEFPSQVWEIDQDEERSPPKWA